jgi:LDH2 family malate/lactate/ureidoglycolate dehydrogenase
MVTNSTAGAAARQDQVRIPAEELQATCVAILEKAGLPPADATVAADCLVQADLRGVDTHGVIHLPIYVRRIRLGLTNAHPRLVVVRETAATVLLDGDHGLGQVVAARAMERAIALTERSGVGVVGVRNSTHFGMAAYFAMMALGRDMVGLVVNSGRVAMPPWGGAEAMIGNNPVAVAVPAGQERPIVLDMAMSVAARGKIKRALRRGEPIPPDWATDRLGRPTTDPTQALAGLLSPIGGPKGYGLALVNGLLAGVLMGGTFAWEVGSVYDDLDRPQRVGHMLAAIAVDSFTPVAAFKARVDELIREIRSCPTAPGVERVYLPGEIEFECHEERSRDGIPLSRALWGELCEMAQGTA